MKEAGSKKLVGIEIGGTKLQVITGDASGNIMRHLRYVIDPDAGAVGIQVQLKAAFSTIGKESIGAVGVGFGGPVDWKTGIIKTSHQVSGWSKFPLKDWLQDLTGATVVIENDANVAALAEAVHGVGKGYDSVFYMTIGSGIGGGVVVDKTIFHGATPGEAEIGHVRLTKEGNTLESECSGWAVNKKVRAYIKEHPKSLVAQLALQQNTPEATLLKPALEKEDKGALEIITAVADDLAFVLSHVVHLFHPQMLIMGGGLSLLGEHLRRPVVERLPQYVMQAFHPLPIVQTASLGENAVPMGALELAKSALQHIQI